jgi:hypothetical protein
MFTFLYSDKEKSQEEQSAHSAWIHQQYTEVVAPGREKIHNALHKIAEHMFDNLEGFRVLLQRACFQYQALNHNHFFKSSGRQRAQQLSAKLDRCLTCAEILFSLNQSLAHGNYDADSFKTVLHQRIINTYPCYKEILKIESLNACWIVLDKFFQILCEKIEGIDKHIPGLIL